MHGERKRPPQSTCAHLIADPMLRDGLGRTPVGNTQAPSCFLLPGVTPGALADGQETAPPGSPAPAATCPIGPCAPPSPPPSDPPLWTPSTARVPKPERCLLRWWHREVAKPREAVAHSGSGFPQDRHLAEDSASSVSAEPHPTVSPSPYADAERGAPRAEGAQPGAARLQYTRAPHRTLVCRPRG